MAPDPAHLPDPHADAGAPLPSPAATAALRPIRFVHQGRVVAIPPGAPGLRSTTTVLQWLREQRRLTGTKEGCNEGDCGACTVLLGRLVPAGDAAAAGAGDTRVLLEPINACIALLPTLDGRALLTVDDLGGRHPAQQAMVACHGSQCGFCTPGFVMTLAALQQRQATPGGAGTLTLPATTAATASATTAATTAAAQAITPAAGAPARPPTRQALADALAGNLCRCTGYRPILDAAEAMLAQAPAPAIDTAPLAAQLATLAADPPLRWADAEGARFSAPRSAQALAAERLQRPEARILAGSTDIGLWVTKQFRPLPDLLYLGRVDEIQALGTLPAHPDDTSQAPAGWLQIGAGASLEAAWAALAAHWPALREMGLRFASPPVRHAGTLGGNLANGSPIGDSAPVLLALDAQLLLRQGEAQRWLPLRDFYLDYMRNALQPGEWLQAIRVPLPPPAPDRDRERLRAYKLSQRHDCDISALACGLWLRLDAAGRVQAARLAFGGMAATVRRAPQAEAALIGRPWDDEATLQAAAAALAQDYQPLTDLRASAGHRRRMAGALLRRFWLQTRPTAPLATEETALW